MPIASTNRICRRETVWAAGLGSGSEGVDIDFTLRFRFFRFVLLPIEIHSRAGGGRVARTRKIDTCAHEDRGENITAVRLGKV